MATEQASLPIAWPLYLPETWAKDRKRRKEAGIPKEISFATKPTIALQQVRQAIEEEVTSAPVLADADYGNDSQFREGLTKIAFGVCRRCSGNHDRLEMWRSSLVREAVEGTGTPTETAAPG